MELKTDSQKYQRLLFTHFKIYKNIFTLIISILLQLGTIINASDFKSAEYNEQTGIYQSQDLIIKDEIVY